MLVMVSSKDEMLGHIEFFKTVNYLDEYELSYQVYAPEQRGKGVATEAVNLLVRYLFETKRVNRIRLVIHPDNIGFPPSGREMRLQTRRHRARGVVSQGCTSGR